MSYEDARACFKKNFRLDANESNARLRIIMLNASYARFCKQRGWKLVQDSPKAAIEHIISALQPPALKTIMQDALRLEKTSLQNDYKGFMKYLGEKSIVYEEAQPLREYRQSSSKPRAPPNAAEKQTVPSSDKKKESTTKMSDTSGNKKAKKLPHCLKNECNEDRFVKDCIITSKEEAKKILDEYREKKKAKPTSVSALMVPTSAITVGT